MPKLALLLLGSVLLSCWIGHPLPLLVTVLLCWVLFRYCGEIL